MTFYASTLKLYSTVAPGPPRSLRAIKVGRNRIDVAWLPPINLGTPILSGYNIIRTNLKDHSVNVFFNRRRIYSQFTKLQPGVTYIFQVNAVSQRMNHKAEGNWSFLNVTTLCKYKLLNN